MKLPFDFGVKLFFRLLLPGVLLTLGLSPLLFMLWDWIGETFRPYLIKDEIAFFVVAILLGWIVIVCDMPIYMIFEGRRYWPKRLWTFFYKLEKKRLARIKEILKTYDPRSNEYLEASVELKAFPVADDNGEYIVKYPSRLGNLITAYETYPDSRYGMDGVFYWSRIWLVLEKDTRDNIDNNQAMADSAIYASIALFINGFLWFIYATVSSLYALFALGHTLPFKYFPPIAVLWGLSIACFLLGYGLYRLSLFVQGQFGELIKSMYDIYRRRMDSDLVLDVLDEIIKWTDDPLLGMRSRREKRAIVWYYLEYYRIRCPVCHERLYPHAAKAHLKQEQIRAVQQRLKGVGIDPGPSDGNLGPQTQEALRQYQRAQGLPQTGQLDEMTKERLLNQTTQN